jgi:hypothetical protein
LGRRINLHDLEVLDGLGQELGETDDARRGHRDAGVDREDRHAGAIGNDAGGEIEIDFFGAHADEDVVGVTGREIVVTDLKDLLGIGGLIRHRAL